MAERLRKKKRGPVRAHVTPAGYLTLLGALLVGFSAAQTHAPYLFVLCGALVSAVIFSVAVADWMLSPVVPRRNLPDRIRQGETVHVGYFLRNRRRRGACLGVSVEELQTDDVESASGYCVHLPAGGSFRAAGRFVARKRGPLALTGVRIRTTFPFGLILATRDLVADREVIVWPALGSLKTPLLHHGASEISRDRPGKSQGGEDEFFGLREYRPGDELRWVHWRRSATRRVPVVREMSRPYPDRLWLFVETNRALLGDVENLEPMLRFAGTVVEYAFGRGYQVGLGLPGLDEDLLMRPAAGRGGRRAVLDALACARAGDRSDLSHVLRSLRSSELRHSHVLVSTTRIGSRRTPEIASAGAGCDCLTVLCREDLDQAFDDPMDHRVEARSDPSYRHSDFAEWGGR